MAGLERSPEMEPLSYSEFISDVLPHLKNECRCGNPAFQKLISFNFEDYGIKPCSLLDSEFLIQEIVRNTFEPLEEGNHWQGESKRQFRCRICHRVCTETYSEYSISMYRSFVLFDDDLRSERGTFVLGYRAFDDGEFDKVSDFSIASDLSSYLASLTEK